MVINLNDGLSMENPNKKVSTKPYDIKGMLYGEEIDVKISDAFDIDITLKAKHIYDIKTDVNMVVTRQCSRCLDDVKEEYEIEIDTSVDTENKTSYDQEENETYDISYIEDCNLDVDGMILDFLYTKLPMKVLCKEDCKGICNVCGINLNKQTCDCDRFVPDPRMAVFGDIFNQFKEV